MEAQGGAEALLFTPAELAFLALASDEPGGEKSARVLCLGGEPGDAVRTSGVGSLVIRGLLKAADGADGVELSAELAALSILLGGADRWVQAAFVGPQGASSTFGFASEHAVLVARVESAGVMSLATLEETRELFLALRQAAENAVRLGFTSISLTDESGGEQRALFAEFSETGWDVAQSSGGLSESVNKLAQDGVVDAIRAWTGW